MTSEPLKAAPGQGRPPDERFAALTVNNYRRFVAGQSISLVGSWTETVAQAVLILNLTHSAVALGLATALRYLPVLLLAAYSGLVVDRHDRRRMLLLTESSLGALSLLFGIVVLTGQVTVWWVFAMALAFGVLTALDNPARMALIPEIVPKPFLHSAITLNSILANVGRGLGPLVAAALVSSIGVGWCFVVNAVSFGAVITSLLSMHVTTIHSEGTISRSPGQLRTALRVARGDAQILGPLTMMALIGTLTYEFEVSLPVFAERSLHAGATEYAWLTAGFGAGAVMAGILLLFKPQTGVSRMIYIALAYGAAVAVTACSPNRGFANVAIIAVGACSIAFLTTGNATIQLSAPPGMRGRITSLWTMAFQGSTPIGALVIGGIDQKLGGRTALTVGAAACLCAAAAAMVILRLDAGRRAEGTSHTQPRQ